MAILQLLIDAEGDVVGFQRVPTSLLTEAVTAASQSYSFGTTQGQSRLAADRRYTLLVEQSKKLTTAEKSQIETLILGRPQTDTVAIAPAPLPPVIPPPLTDPSTSPARPLIMVYVDP